MAQQLRRENVSKILDLIGAGDGNRTHAQRSASVRIYSPSISTWAHLGAEFLPQRFAHLVHCIPLRIADQVTVDSQRDSRIRVPHLLFRERRIRSYFQ